MSRFERDHDAPLPMGSNADAEDSAANIAELVRRTAERRAAPGPSMVGPDMPTARQPQIPAPVVARPVKRVGPPAAPPAGSRMWVPSPRALVIAGALVAALIAGFVVLSNPFGPGASPNPTPTLASALPAGYAVQATDEITDCASHARGRTKTSFGAQPCVKATRSLATGQVSGRPALFVASRIEMASPEAAATIKQVLDGSGTGNLNDLLREGKSFPGAPEKMPTSGYASVQTGAIVAVAEAGFVDGGRSSSTDAALRAAAAQVATMVSARG